MANSKEHYLIERNISAARNFLLTVTKLLDHYNVPYHLEGGALLGIVRDNDLLPWDHDIDLSIPSEYATAIGRLKIQLLIRGYRISSRKSKQNVGPIKKGDYTVFKIKPLFAYYLNWFLPKRQSIVMDIFIKTKDNHHTYWQAKNKVMRVENKYYQSFELVEFFGHQLKAPNKYRDYLTEKYGNWSVVVKDWDCGENEGTIIN